MWYLKCAQSLRHGISPAILGLKRSIWSVITVSVLKYFPSHLWTIINDNIFFVMNTYVSSVYFAIFTHITILRARRHTFSQDAKSYHVWRPHFRCLPQKYMHLFDAIMIPVIGTIHTSNNLPSFSITTQTYLISKFITTLWAQCECRCRVVISCPTEYRYHHAMKFTWDGNHSEERFLLSIYVAIFI